MQKVKNHGAAGMAGTRVQASAQLIQPCCSAVAQPSVSLVRATSSIPGLAEHSGSKAKPVSTAFLYGHWYFSFKDWSVQGTVQKQASLLVSTVRQIQWRSLSFSVLSASDLSSYLCVFLFIIAMVNFCLFFPLHGFFDKKLGEDIDIKYHSGNMKPYSVGNYWMGL